MFSNNCEQGSRVVQPRYLRSHLRDGDLGDAAVRCVRDNFRRAATHPAGGVSFHPASADLSRFRGPGM